MKSPEKGRRKLQLKNMEIDNFDFERFLTFNDSFNFDMCNALLLKLLMLVGILAPISIQ